MNSQSSLRADFTELSPTSYKVDVTVPPDDFRQKLDKRYNELSLNTKIPGFRPGKAPRNILNRHFGWDYILRQTIEDVVEETIWLLVKKRELTVVGRPRIKPGEYTEGQDFTYNAVFEVIPQIPQVDYENLKGFLPKRELTDETIENELRAMAIRMGKSTGITDRPVRTGDFATVELSGEVPDVILDTLTGDSPWKYSEENLLIEIGSGKAIAGLEDVITGMELEEIKEFDLPLGDEFGDPRVRGKAMKAKVRLKAVSHIDIPELTDEFIKEKMGKSFESLDQLKQRIREEISSNHNKMDNQLKLGQIEAQLSRNYDFPLPEGLVRSEFANVLDRSLTELKERGYDLDQIMDEKNEIGIRLRKKARYQAERIVRLNLLMNEIARKESINVDQNEVVNYIAMLAYRAGVGEKDLKQWIHDPHFLQKTREELMFKKVSQLLIDKINVDIIDPDEFTIIMEESRIDGEKNEKEFLSGIDDPFNTLGEDHLDAVSKSASDADTIPEAAQEERELKE